MEDIFEALRVYEHESMISKVNKATANIKGYIKNNNHNTKEDLEHVLSYVKVACDYWTGKTYVGQRKREDLKNAYQDFFSALMEILLLCKANRSLYENKAAKKYLYQGKIYRYLGYNSPYTCKQKAIKPEYDGVYVSWSKEPKNSYLESKLYGKITWIEAEIKSPYFGIDLDAMNSSRGNEKEVVFPTLKDCVTKVEYKGENE